MVLFISTAMSSFCLESNHKGATICRGERLQLLSFALNLITRVLQFLLFFVVA